MTTYEWTGASIAECVQLFTSQSKPYPVRNKKWVTRFNNSTVFRIGDSFKRIAISSGVSRRRCWKDLWSFSRCNFMKTVWINNIVYSSVGSWCFEAVVFDQPAVRAFLHDIRLHWPTSSGISSESRGGKDEFYFIIVKSVMNCKDLGYFVLLECHTISAINLYSLSSSHCRVFL